MNYSQLKSACDKHYAYFLSELDRMQVGRASKSLVDYIVIKTSYGDNPLGQVANISLVDGMTIKIEPWDKSLMKHIVDAIYAADQWLSPRAGDSTVLVSIPPMTGEKRKALAKTVSTMAEDTKARIRTSRQDAMNTIKKLFADKAISEDQKKIDEKNVDDLIKEYVAKVDSAAKKKETEILTV